MSAISGNRSSEDDYCDIKGDFFNLTKLHHLRMIHTHLHLRPSTDYWMVYSPNGVALSNWKTKIKVIEILMAIPSNGERVRHSTENAIYQQKSLNSADKSIFVLVECAIMDGNYVFRQLYDFAEYTFYEYL